MEYGFPTNCGTAWDDANLCASQIYDQAARQMLMEILLFRMVPSRYYLAVN
jgi:hypothetical protein